MAKMKRGILISFAILSALNIAKVEANAYVGCYDESAVAPVYFAGGIADNSSLTVADCCSTCSILSHTYCALSETTVCQCSDTALTVASTCSDFCPADPTMKCGRINFTAAFDVYSASGGGGGGGNLTFTMTVDITTNPLVIAVQTKYDLLAEQFMIYFGDEASIINVVGATNTTVVTPPRYTSAISYDMFVIPKTYDITVFGVTPEESDVYSQTFSGIQVNATASIDLIQCPVIEYPDLPYLCNVSVTYQNDDHYYTLAFSDLPAAVTNLSTIGTTYATFGPKTPKGPAIDADSGGAAIGEEIVFNNNPVLTKGMIIAIDFVSHLADNFNFELLMPNCSGLTYCFYLRKCLSVCPYDQISNFFSCPGDAFCPLDDTCCTANTSGTDPTWVYNGLVTSIASVPANTGKTLRLSTPVAVEPGWVLRVQGSLKRRAHTDSGSGDTVNVTQTGYHHYAMLTVKQINNISIEHTCIAGNTSISLTVTDLVNTANVYTGPPLLAPTLCERNISFLAVEINQTEVYTYNSSLNLQNPYYVWVGSVFDIINNFPEAGPIKFNFTFTPSIGVETTMEYLYDYPNITGPYSLIMQRTILTPATYELQVVAFNTHNLQPDILTGIIPGGLAVNLTIIAQHPISPAWTVAAYNGYLNSFVIPFNITAIVFKDLNAQPFPTDAVLTIEWNDGSATQITNFTDPGTSEPVVNHTFLAAGVFTIVCSIENKVSELTINTTITIYSQILNFAVTNMYYPSATSTLPKTGFGLGKLQFPMDRNLTFFPTMTQGTVETYELRFTNNGSLIKSYNVTDIYHPLAPFEYFFNFETVLNLTVSAINTLQTVTFDLYVEIVGQVRGLQVDDYSIVTKSDELKTFQVTFESIGGATCLVLNYGDGFYESYGDEAVCMSRFGHVAYNATVPLDIAMNFTHIYAADGLYNMTAFAFNAISEDDATVMFPVTDIDCSPPTVDLQGQVVDYLSAVTVLRGKVNVVSAIATINCKITQQTKKRWQIFHVDGLTGAKGQPIDIMNVNYTWNQPNLVIPACSLSYGYFLVTYTITMWDPAVLNVNWPFQKVAEHYIYVETTPLVPHLTKDPMSKVLRGLEQFVLLEPAVYTTDPDYPDDKNFTINWRCRTIGESWPTDTTPLPMTLGSTGTGCFGHGPGYFDNSNTSLEIFGKQFRGLGIYEIEAKIMKDTRATQGIIQIEVVASPVPIMDVRCSDNVSCVSAEDGSGIYVNPNERLGLVSTCAEACDAPVAFSWSATLPDQTVVPFGSSDTPVGTTGSEFSLATSFYDTNSAYKEIWLCVDATNSDPSGPKTGRTTYFLKINQKPVGGVCYIDKYEGKVLIDTFQLSCSGWVDPENKGIALYIVRLLQNGSTPVTLAEHQNTNFPIEAIPLSLPVGVHDIEITIQDVWGGKTLVTLPQPVTVSEITEAEFMAFDSSSLVASLLGGGDLNMLTMVLNARNSIINNSPFFDVNAANLTEEEKKARMVAINKMQAESVNALMESMSFQTQGSTEAAAGILADIMLKTSETPDSTLIMDYFTRGDIYDILDKMVEQIGKMPIGDPENLRKLMESVSTIAAGLVVGVEEASTLGCNRIGPVDLDKNANEVDYDTEIKGLDMVIPEKIDDAKKCNMMDLIKAGNKVQMPRLMNIMDKMSQYVLQKQVQGEVMTVPTKNNMTVISELLPPYGLGGRHNCSLSWIEFPEEFCPQGSCYLPVSLSLREWPTVTYLSMKSAEQLTGGSRVLDVDIYDRNTELIEIKDVPQKIKLGIYRTPYKRSNISSPDPVIVNATEESKTQTIPIMYSKFINDKNGTGISIEITPSDPNIERLFVMISKDKQPTPHNHEFFKLVQDIPVQSNGSYTWFLSNHQISATGTLYVGVAEYSDSVSINDARKPNKTLADFLTLLKKPMTVNYNLRIFTSGCYYFNKKNEQWDDPKMEVVGSTIMYGRCDANHLTSFSSGLFCLPNTINFSFVFANMGFTDNLTIYVTLIISLATFILLMIWAMWQDRKDIKKLGSAPLPDNQLNDKYLYEILVFTGNKKEAQTDSTVQFVLHGDYGETDVRTFGDSERKIFRKGDVDVFVMAIPKSLGPLWFLRIWHDNSGKGPNASWYLSYIVFRDIQTGQKYEFICNDWLALEKSDGQIDRVMGVAGQDEKTEFSHLFHNTANKKLVDGHLWFSIFLRPPRSRFTRCQRVASCFALLFLSMLVNAMWYERVPSKPSPGAFSFGPFDLSPEQIGVGVMSNLIVFPPSFLIIFLFRRSRPKVLRKSRIQESLKRASKETRKTKYGEEFEDSDDADQDEKETAKTAEVPTSQPDTNVKKNTKKTQKKKKKLTLPWWCQYLAWLLVFACIGAAIFFLLMYGIMFGNEKATKWISSLFISFFSSILLVEPIKVFLLSMLLSIVCKNLDMDEDDADEDEEAPDLQKDELWLYEGEKSQRLGYSELDPEMLEEMRRKRVKDNEMWSLITELCVYASFIWVLLILSYGQRDPNGWFLQNSLRQIFIREGSTDGTDFSAIGTTDMLWYYLHHGFMAQIRADFMYNGQPPYQLRGFLNDYANRIMGYATIRQIRVKKNSCRISGSVKSVIKQCAAFPNLVNEEHRNYCRGWRIPTNQTKNTTDCLVPEFRYETAEQLKSLAVWGKKDMYGGGGYVIHLSGPTTEILDRFTYLQRNRWIDKMTRAVLIEFSTYNTQVNLFAICTIMAEFIPGGGIDPSFRFDAITLLENENNFGSFVIACQVLFCIFLIYFTIHELTLLCKQKKRYFDSYWSYAELALIFVSYCAIIIYLLRHLETKAALKIFNETNGNGYVRMTYAATINETYSYAVSFLVFVGTLKFIKLLRFNRRMGFLSATLHHCWDELSGFLIAFAICFFAFVVMFYFVLGPFIEGFADPIGALETCFSMMMGKFSFYEMMSVNPMVPVMFFVFVLCTTWILINLLMTLIMKSFAEVRADSLNQPSECEIVDYVFSNFKKFIRKSAPASFKAPTKPSAEEETKDPLLSKDVGELPSKVDKFLEYINKAYFGGTMDLKSKYAMADSLGERRRQVVGSEQEVGVEHIGFGRKDVLFRLDSNTSSYDQ